MQVRIEELKKSFGEALTSANSAEALEALRVEYLGKKGHVAELMKGLRDVADKKAAGQLINTLKTEVEEKIASECGCKDFQVLIDIPEKISFESDLWIKDENTEALFVKFDIRLVFSYAEFDKVAPKIPPTQIERKSIFLTSTVP